MAALDWSQCPAVEGVPGKVSGAWVLPGIGMPVATIFENLEADASPDDILCCFDGLNREPVKAVIDFAARSLETPAQTRCARPFRARQARSPSLIPYLRLDKLALVGYCCKICFRSGHPGERRPPLRPSLSWRQEVHAGRKRQSFAGFY